MVGNGCAYGQCFIQHATSFNIFGSNISPGQVRKEFNTSFGTKPFVCVQIWKRIQEKGHLPRGRLLVNAIIVVPVFSEI
jgi:hypothetical protein